jgi:thioesterase domain-containing protein
MSEILSNASLVEPISETLGPGAPAEGASETTEEALVKIWTEVLGFGGFTKEQEFFHLGGTSLSAFHLLARIQTVLGKSVPMQVLLKGMNIVDMAKFLDELPPAMASLLYPFQSKGDKPPLFCLPCQAGDLVCYANMERHLSSDRPVYGVQSNRLFDIEEGGVLEEIAASCVQTILQQQAVGPFHLFGFCFAGLLAYEVARQLWEKGAWIGVVIVMDHSFPDNGRRNFMSAGPSGVATFVSNLWHACGELLFSTTPERAANLSRLKMRLRGVLRGKRWDEALESEENVGCLTAAQALYRIHDQACRNYLPGRYRGEVTLLRPRRMPIFRTHDPTYGWNEVQADRLRVKIVPGPGWHGAPLKEPHVAGLVRIVECCMREAELTPGTPSLTPGPSALFSSTRRL